jgi:hypothetical protein
LRRVIWYNFTDVLEVLAASIIMAMIMEAASTSETSVNVYQTTRRNNPEDSDLHVLIMRPRNRWEDNIKIYLKKQGVRVRTGFN